MERNKNTVKAKEKSTFFSRFLEAFEYMLPFAAIILLGILIFSIFLTFYSINAEKFDMIFKETPFKDLVMYILSWIILCVISWLAFLQIKEIIRSRASEKLRLRANYIAIMVGMVITVVLFKQSFLIELFGSQTPGFWIKAVLFGGGSGIGWVIWYLKQLKKYGEFFNIFLMTTVVGFCWYARLTAPESTQISAIGFLLGSLVRIAKDYLDKSSDLEHTQSKHSK